MWTPDRAVTSANSRPRLGRLPYWCPVCGRCRLKYRLSNGISDGNLVLSRPLSGFTWAGSASGGWSISRNTSVPHPCFDCQRFEPEGVRADRLLEEQADQWGPLLFVPERDLFEADLGKAMCARLPCCGDQHQFRRIQGNPRDLEGMQEDNESWLEFLRHRAFRGPSGVQLVIRDKCRSLM